MSDLFVDRRSAGRRLALELMAYADRTDVIVLALPRGGVPVAFEVAQALRVDLDVFLVRKLGAPRQAELAMGAIASGGTLVRNDQVLRGLEISEEAMLRAIDIERRELERRERAYRGDRPLAEVTGRVVLLVDDGMATGTTMRAAVDAVHRLAPAKVIVAVPVASASADEQIRNAADGVVCLAAPSNFFAVGQFYADFSQTTDDEVRELLSRARTAGQPRTSAHPGTSASRSARTPPSDRSAI